MMLIPAARMLPFLAVAIVLVVAPGPDFAMVTRNALMGGRRAGVVTALGVATGTAVWSAASVAGIVALLSLWALAFLVLKLLGAAYLCFLGLRSLIGAFRKSSPEASPVKSLVHLGRTPFQQGLFCNVLNPKAAVIFSSVIPQFVVRGSSAAGQLTELGLVFLILVATWLSVYSLVAGSFKEALQRPRVRRVIDGITGSALLGFGCRLAISR